MIKFSVSEINTINSIMELDRFEKTLTHSKNNLVIFDKQRKSRAKPSEYYESRELI